MTAAPGPDPRFDVPAPAAIDLAHAPGPGAGIRVDDVSLTFRGARTTTALEHLSLEVAPREVVALIGPNGCGKSTLLRVLAGLIAPDAGSVTIDGRPVTGPDPSIGLVFQEPRLLAWRSVDDNVRLPDGARGLAARSPGGPFGGPARARRAGRGRRRQAVDAQRRHAAARRDRTGARARARRAPARRAVQRARRAHPRAVQRRAPHPLAAHRHDDRPRHALDPRGRVPRRPRRRPVAATRPRRGGHPRSTCPGRGASPTSTPRPPDGSPPRSGRTSSTRRTTSDDEPPDGTRDPGRVRRRARRRRRPSAPRPPLADHVRAGRRVARHLPRRVAGDRRRRQLPAVHPARAAHRRAAVREGVDGRHDVAALRHDARRGPARVRDRGDAGDRRRRAARALAARGAAAQPVPRRGPGDADPGARAAHRPVVRHRPAEQARDHDPDRVLPGRRRDDGRAAVRGPAADRDGPRVPGNQRARSSGGSRSRPRCPRSSAGCAWGSRSP